MADDVVGRASVEVEADTRPFDRQLARRLSASARKAGRDMERGLTGAVRRGLDGIGSSVKRTFSTLGKTAAIGFAGAFVAGAAGIGKAISLGADLGESIDKASFLFGKAGDTIIDASEEMADKFGVVRSEFIEGASDIANIAVASGLTSGAATQLGADFAKLAGDVASVNNIPLDEALAAIRSGLVGETEPLRRFGVLLNAASVEAKALELGLADANGEISEGAKAQARAALITEGFARQSGNLEATQDSLANVVKSLRGRVTNLAAEFGFKMAPAAAKVLKAVEPLFPILSKMGEVLAGTLARGAETAAGAIERFVEKVIAFDEGRLDLDLTGSFIEDSVKDAIDQVDADGLFDQFLDLLSGAIKRAPTEKITSIIVEFMTRAITAVAKGSTQITVALLPALIQALPEIAIGFGKGLLQAFVDNPIEVGAFVLALGALPATVTTALATLIGRIPLAGTIGSLIIRALSGIGRFLLSPLTRIFGGSLSGGLIGGLRVGVQGLVRAIPAAIGGAVGSLVGAILAGVAAGFGLNWLIERLAPGVNRAIEGVGGALFDFFAALPGFLNRNLQRFGGFIFDFFSRLPGQMLRGLQRGIGAVIRFFRELPGRILRAVGGVVRNLINLGRDAMRGLRDGISQRVGSVIEFVRGIPGRVVRGIGNLGGRLVQAGRDLIGGLIRGIRARAGEVLSTIKRFITDKIPGFVKRALGIKSPSTLFRGFGRDLVDGLIVGIEDRNGALDRTLVDMAHRAGSFNADALAIPTRTATPRDIQLLRGPQPFGSQSGVTQNITINEVATDPEATARAVSARLARGATR